MASQVGDVAALTGAGFTLPPTATAVSGSEDTRGIWFGGGLGAGFRIAAALMAVVGGVLLYRRRRSTVGVEVEKGLANPPASVAVRLPEA